MIYGIDVGGTKIEIAVYADDLNAVDRWRTATPTESYDAFIETLANLIGEADAKFGVEGTVGLGIPGLIDAEGRSLSSNIPAANGRNVRRDLSARIGRKVTIGNDCRCFALSEATGGAGEGFRNVYGAVLGTGAAGGFVVDGVLEAGRQGIAGEYGHIPLPALMQQRYDLPLRQCGCGLPSCVEGYISGPGLMFLQQYFGGSFADAPTLASAWRAGDGVAEKTFDVYLDILGSTFATLVLLHDPDIIVLGGGVSLIDGIPERLPGAIEEHLFNNAKSPIIRRAKFGDASGSRGAAILANQALKSSQ